MATPKHIVFDVVGTLATYDKFFEAIEKTLGERLRAYGVNGRVLGLLWIEVAEREYTYLSISGNYTRYQRVFEAVLPRILGQIGVPSPLTLASSQDLAEINQGYIDMELSPEAIKCVAKLRAAGFTVWGLTMDDPVRVRDFFLNAGVDMPLENFVACDSTGVAKPAPEVYRPLLDRLKKEGATPWFAAAHQWDTAAARRTGFRGAYCTTLEGLSLPEIFGDMEVVSDTLDDMADEVIRQSW